MVGRVIVYLFLTLIIAGCTNTNRVSVKGTINNPQQKYIKLWKVDVNLAKLTDSARISGNGTFKFKFSAGEPEFYQLGYSQSEFVTLLIQPGDNVYFSFENPNLQGNYFIEGSEDSEKIRDLDLRLNETKRKLDSLALIYESAAAESESSKILEETEKEIYKEIIAQRRYSITFILDNLTSLTSIKALYQKLNDESYVLFDRQDLQIMKLLTDSLTVKYPESRQVKAMADDFKRELSNLQFDQLQALAESIEPIDPDPDLVNLEGKRVALSSLRGKYVLLTFWSAESRDCITNNLQLKEYYKMYNRNGFEIYQINVDVDEQKWRNAVRFDELPWVSVREDNPSNPKFANLYNVQSLPTNYLYNREGEIIGSNLFGKALSIKLEQIFDR